MSDAAPGLLSLEEVRHVAKLARLKLGEEDLERYRSQLSIVLEHIARLRRLDVEGVMPLAHPTELSNRLEADEVAESMPVEQLLAIAPAVEDSFLAVPKVLGEP